MKRIFIAFLILISTASAEGEFAEGTFLMSVDKNHPIWEIWLQDVPKEQKESAKKQSLERIQYISYSLEAGETYTAELIPPPFMINEPLDKIKLIKTELNGKTVYTNQTEGVTFQFEKGVVYLIPENRLDYRITLKKIKSNKTE
jgi:hypothetical protein